MDANNVANSYATHEQIILDRFNTQKEETISLLQRKDHLSYWIHSRIHAIVNPLLKEKHTWLTVGDFYGQEASYLKKHNQSVIASDLSDIYLKELKSLNLIDECRSENAEHLSLGDSSVDYVFCKEAFHHFPRAYLGIYEMVRVSGKGAILIEPVDVLAKMPLLLFVKNILDCFNPHFINKIWKNRFSWEKGPMNYVFKISEREIEKIAMGMGLPCIAFKRINHVTASRNAANFQYAVREIKRKLYVLNLLSFLRLIPYRLLCSIIFKEMPQESVLNDLKNSGYTIVKLPKNPYLSENRGG
jgi:ubiquinone/menaquinone biosynthesis C-methylase UbiE